MNIAVSARATQEGIQRIARNTISPSLLEAERTARERVEAKLRSKERVIDALKFEIDRLQSQIKALGEASTTSGHEIIKEISRLHDVPPGLMKGPRRSQKLVLARHHAMYEIYRRCDWMSLPEIGHIFGDRDHTTILHAVRSFPAKAEIHKILIEPCARLAMNGGSADA